MIFLLDTHLLLWAAGAPENLSPRASETINDTESGLMFSAAAIWEVGIKSSLGRDDFAVDPRVLRRALLENGYAELEITSEHACAVLDLPRVHNDSFDRIQIAQARVEGLVLLTSDSVLADYGSPVELV